MRRSVVRSERLPRFDKSKASPSGGSWLRREAEQTDEGQQTETRKRAKRTTLLLIRLAALATFPMGGRLTIRDMFFFHLFSCPPGYFCFLPFRSPIFPCARKISRCARNDDTGKAVFSFSACLKRIPHSLSYRQYPIRPFGAPSPRGEGLGCGSGILISLPFPSGRKGRLGAARLHASGAAP